MFPLKTKLDNEPLKFLKSLTPYCSNRLSPLYYRSFV